MRIVHSALAACVLALGFANLVEAQQPRPAPQGGRMATLAVVDRWLEGITLSPAQRAAIDSLRASHAPRLQELRGEMRAAARDSTAGRDTIMKRMDALHAEVAAGIRVVLTAPQQAVFDRNREAVDTQRGQMIRRRTGGPR